MSKFITPAGIAKYTHIVEPDTQGKYATGKYTTKLVLTPEEAKPFIETVEKECAKHKLGKDANRPYKADTKKEGENKVKTGNIIFSFSSKFKPALIDAKNKTVNVKKLPDDFYVGSGSRIQIGGEFYHYDKGVSLQLQQVRIFNLVNNQASMFGDAEGEDGNFDGSDFMDDAANDNDDGDSNSGGPDL